MGLRSLLQGIPSVTAAELRQELDGAGREAPVLVDVREPAEYERGHLPGARLIPLGALADRARELDPAARTVTY